MIGSIRLIVYVGIVLSTPIHIAEGSIANNQQETSELPEVIDSRVANLIQELATSKDRVMKSVTVRCKDLHGRNEQR